MPKRTAGQLNLPGLYELRIAGKTSPRKSRIPHREILKALQQASGMGSRGLIEIYHSEVLTVKTRTIRLLGRKISAHIFNTLLGFEVKASFKRIQCPDMATARYLKIFTELGCRTIKLPYDPTVTARLLPELEVAQERLVSGVRLLFPQNKDLQLYVLRHICRYIRHRLRVA